MADPEGPSISNIHPLPQSRRMDNPGRRDLQTHEGKIDDCG
jgi:hypothetical protein